MESVYLRTLVEIFKTGSLSKAAETLCVTQPAVSKRIKFLEERYGYPLLERVGNSLRITEAGRLVVEKAEKVLAIEAELLAGLHNLSGKNKIAFSCTPAFGICHLPKILKDFMLHYTDLVDLKFSFETPGNIVKGLNGGLFDLAVMEHCEYFDHADFSTLSLPDDSMIFFSSPELRLSSPVAQLDQLLGKTLFTRKEGCCCRIMLEKNLKQMGRDLREFRRIIVFDDLQVIIKAVLDGDGISFLSRDLVSDYISMNVLAEHQLTGFDSTCKRSLVFSEKCSRNSCLDHFADTVCRCFNLPPFSS